MTDTHPAQAVAQLLQRFESAAKSRLPSKHVLFEAVEVVELRERQAAFREHARHPYLYFVRHGLLKQLYTGQDGSEWIKSFAAEGDAFGCPLAFAPGGKTSFASVAVERSVVERAPWATIDALAARHPAWQRALRLGFQWLAERKVQRERDLLMLRPPELYAAFAAASPELLARLPQKDLAAYLGVTAVGLNRIIRRTVRAGLERNAEAGHAAARQKTR
ncbi:Crp/Fnr family transcriptional regulator [Luteimonas aquatica]|uniref:Crp/Fnr family transcriptional regulator n=1 Tax=Luteimonas aquatica TaxID=450364 RepID=UPI001F5A2EFF|nr:Crp/Fnr family transcriptional regulator [Luteimonas aquatica]